MANSLMSGVSGLQASQQMLDVVGNNLANSNTTGYKAQQVSFSDILYQTLRPASGSGSGQAGGLDPIQQGAGVAVSAISTNQQQGNLQHTGNDWDLAIQGGGFFVVSNGAKTSYTRAGAFSIDSQNYLSDLSTGYRLQRYGSVGEAVGGAPGFQAAGDDRIKIPLGTGIPAKETTTITLQGNVSADAKGPLAETLTTGQAFLAGGVAAVGATTLNSLDSNTVHYVAGDQLRLQGTTAAGASVNTTVAVPTDMNGLLAAINAAFPGSTATLDASGNVVLKANATGPSPLSLTISDVAGNTGQTNWSGHAFVETQKGQNGDTVPSAIQFFDTLGRAHSLSLVLQKQADNTWNLTGTLASGDGTVTDGLVQGIVFNPNGSLQQVTGTGVGDINMTFQLNGLVAPQSVQFNLGKPGGFDGLTQFGAASSAAASAQDGYTSGVLSSVTVNQDGILVGLFSNGQTQNLAQLALAQFTNPGGLNRDGSNYLSETDQSGTALVGAANSGGRGAIQQGALESSNVDVALEFTRLIIAQRGFQVNARTITVSDQVLQELANIIH